MKNQTNVPFYQIKSLLDFLPFSTLLYHPFISRFPWLKKFLFKQELFFRSIQIKKIIRKEKCKSIVACSGDIFDIPASYCVGKELEIPVIPYYFDDYVYQWSDSFTREFAYNFENLIFKHNNKVLVPNEFMQIELLRRQNVTATLIRNPVNPESRTPFSIENRSKQMHTILYTGAVYHVNLSALRTLITAINQINEINMNFHLYTAQSKELLENEGISGDKVKIHGHASPKEIAFAQQNADILFIPFSFDSIVPEVIKTSAPGKLADYLVSGVPILAFVPPDCFVAWFLKTNYCGLVIDKNDPQLLKKRIVELILDHKLQRKIVHNAQIIAENEFDVKNESHKFYYSIMQAMGYLIN